MTQFSHRSFLSSALMVPALLRQTSSARFISTIPLGTPGVLPPPFGRLLGAGLDARLFTDLSGLGPESTIDSAIRSSTDSGRPDPSTSSGSPRSASRGELVEGRIPQSGTLQARAVLSSSNDAFAVLDRVRPSAASYRVLVSGVDDEVTPSRTSVPGASWIFSRDDLQRTTRRSGRDGSTSFST